MKINEVKQLLRKEFYYKSFLVKRINGRINVEINNLNVDKKKVKATLESAGIKECKITYSYNIRRLFDEYNIFILNYIMRGMVDKNDVVSLESYNLSLDYNGLFVFIVIEDSNTKHYYRSDVFMSSYLEDDNIHAVDFIETFTSAIANSINSEGQRIFN